MTAARPVTTLRASPAAGRPRRRVRLIEVVRGSWGLVLLVTPERVLRHVHVLTDDSRAVDVTRILGARHLVQAALSGVDPSPEVLAAGVWVDRVHALTALALCLIDPPRRRGAVVDAGVAATWAALGPHDLSTGRTPPRDHDRRRDQLARFLLPHLPGGLSLLDAANMTRRHHSHPVDEPAGQPTEPRTRKVST